MSHCDQTSSDIEVDQLVRSALALCMAVACPKLGTDAGSYEDARLMTDVHYKLMRLLESNPGMSQREIARELGISLGKVNYCLRALIRRGWIKARNFKNSQNKAAYMYLLTPNGLEEKAVLALKFLRDKRVEFEALRLEIEAVQGDLQRRQSGQ